MPCLSSICRNQFLSLRKISPWSWKFGVEEPRLRVNRGLNHLSCTLSYIMESKHTSVHQSEPSRLRTRFESTNISMPFITPFTTRQLRAQLILESHTNLKAHLFHQQTCVQSLAAYVFHHPPKQSVQ